MAERVSMNAFPTSLWLIVLRDTLRWLLAYQPPATQAKLTFGQPRKIP